MTLSCVPSAASGQGTGTVAQSYLDYARRGSNAPWRYGVATVFALVVTMVAGLALTLGLEMAHLVPADLTEQMLRPEGNPAIFFLSTGLIFGLLALGFAVAARLIHHKRMLDLAGDWSWAGFGRGFGIWLAVLVLGALIDFAIAPKGFSVIASPASAKLAVIVLASLAAQTFAEEFLFRGYLTQGLLLVIKRPLPTALLSGLAFGALHIPNGGPQAASAIVFGVVLALIAIRMRGIAFTWGLHFANNSFAAIVLVSNGDAFRGSPGLFRQDTPHLQWWDAAVGGVALILLGLALLRWPSIGGPRARGVGAT